MNRQNIRIELFGIPRLRAGVAEFFVKVDSLPCCLQDIFQRIEEMMPELGKELFEGGKLKTEFIANISGRHFTRELESEVHESDSVLILSQDAGG